MGMGTLPRGVSPIDLHVEQEMHDVALVHHVFLALGTQAAHLARALLAVTGDVVVDTQSSRRG